MLKFFKWTWTTLLEILSTILAVLLAPPLAAILFAIVLLAAAVVLCFVGIAVVVVFAAALLVILLAAALVALSPALTLAWAIKQIINRNRRSKTNGNGQDQVL